MREGEGEEDEARESEEVREKEEARRRCSDFALLVALLLCEHPQHVTNCLCDRKQVFRVSPEPEGTQGSSSLYLLTILELLQGSVRGEVGVGGIELPVRRPRGLRGQLQQEATPLCILGSEALAALGGESGKLVASSSPPLHGPLLSPPLPSSSLPLHAPFPFTFPARPTLLPHYEASATDTSQSNTLFLFLFVLVLLLLLPLFPLTSTRSKALVAAWQQQDEPEQRLARRRSAWSAPTGFMRRQAAVSLSHALPSPRSHRRTCCRDALLTPRDRGGPMRKVGRTDATSIPWS
eukprot:327199-Hanusia_phi.AAC.9